MGGKKNILIELGIKFLFLLRKKKKNKFILFIIFFLLKI
jgi:hypothetical protein